MQLNKSVHDGLSYAFAMSQELPNCPESRRAMLAKVLNVEDEPFPNDSDKFLYRSKLKERGFSPLFCQVNAHRIAHGMAETDWPARVREWRLEKEQVAIEHTPEYTRKLDNPPHAPIIKPDVAFKRSSTAFQSPMGLPTASRSLKF